MVNMVKEAHEYSYMVMKSLEPLGMDLGHKEKITPTYLMV